MLKKHKYLWFILPVLFVFLLRYGVESFTKTPFSLVHTEHSLYKDVQVADAKSLRCMYLGNYRTKGSFSDYHGGMQACIDLTHSKKLTFPYFQWVMASLFFQPTPQRILVIGLGGGVLPRTFYNLFPQAQIDVAELDPAVLSVANHYFQFKEEPHLKVSIGDGRHFVQQAKKQSVLYDIVILDAFNEEYIPEHLLTKEFLTEVKSILTPSGIVVANTFAKNRLEKHEMATYQAVFGSCYIVTASYSGNRMIMASTFPEETVLKQRAQAWEPLLKDFGVSALEIMKLLKKAPTVVGVRVLTDQYSPANLLNSQ
jgi:spermidine synthase